VFLPKYNHVTRRSMGRRDEAHLLATGRQPPLNDEQRKVEIITMANKGLTKADMAREFGMTSSNFKRMLDRLKLRIETKKEREKTNE